MDLFIYFSENTIHMYNHNICARTRIHPTLWSISEELGWILRKTYMRGI
jgi:hypothetical protein